MDNENSPVMPLDPKHSFNDYGYRGLTKREHFAGLAMQGILAGDDGIDWEVNTVADLAVHEADALLAALEKSK